MVVGDDVAIFGNDHPRTRTLHDARSHFGHLAFAKTEEKVVEWVERAHRVPLLYRGFDVDHRMHGLFRSRRKVCRRSNARHSGSSPCLDRLGGRGPLRRVILRGKGPRSSKTAGYT